MKVRATIKVNETAVSIVGATFTSYFPKQDGAWLAIANAAHTIVESGAADITPGTAGSVAGHLAETDPTAALGWAESTLAGIESTLAKLWWELLLPAVPPGASRRRAVTAWAVVGEPD